MLNITVDGGLEAALRSAARRQGKSPEELALAALAAWREDWEAAERARRAFGGGDGGVFTPPEGFWD
ncbi:MAG: hypothetical protein HY985_15325 [Magnetospirillum sp.]|nr:hypothetical protein [Magnetospirillum sp.]